MSVADEGPGIPAADRARAFARFWRRPGADSDDGFGLGLPIVLRLVHASGGDVHLDEAPGGGLLVRVTLRSAAQPSPTPTSDRVGRHRGDATPIASPDVPHAAADGHRSPGR